MTKRARRKVQTERLEIRIGPGELELLKELLEADPRFTVSGYVRRVLAACVRFDRAELRRGRVRIRNDDPWVRVPLTAGQRLERLRADVDPKIQRAERGDRRAG